MSPKRTTKHSLKRAGRQPKSPFTSKSTTDKKNKMQSSPRRSPRFQKKEDSNLNNMPSQYDVIPGNMVLRILPLGLHAPRKDSDYVFLNVENWFQYPDLKNYYGPPNVAHILKFIEEAERYPSKLLCITCHYEHNQILNTLVILAAFLYLVWKMSVEECLQKMNMLLHLSSKKTYKTEGEDPVEDDLQIDIEACIKGLITAIDLKLLDLDSLNIDEIIMREHPFNGDMNWIIPGRILALAGPTDEVFPIDDFILYAKEHNIKTLVRLNRPHYSPERVTGEGIAHHHLFFKDGDIPTPSLIVQFCQIAEQTLRNGNALAVHCRAGLGRTGTMIAIFLIYKYGLQASQVIAFLRMMRPGSVLGIQPRFIHTIQYLLRGESMPSEAMEKLKEYYPNEFAQLSDYLVCELGLEMASRYSKNNIKNIPNRLASQ